MPLRWPWTRPNERALWQVGDLYVPPTAAGEPVTADRALRLSVGFGCVRLLADSVSTLPIAVYRGSDRDPIPLPPLLQRPSADFPEFSDWCWAVMASLLLRGNCWGVITDRAGPGLLRTQVDLVDPDAVAVSNEDGRWVVRIGGEVQDRANLWHVRAFPWAGKLEGLSPVAYARESIGLGIAAEKYGAKFFGDSAIPAGYLYSEQRLGDAAMKQAAAMWKSSHQGRRGTAVLNQVKDHNVSIAPEEAQFLGTIKANVATICRIFGVPAGMMAGSELGGHEDYSSPEQRGTDLLLWTIRPWLARLERAISRLLAVHAGREVQRRRDGPRDPARPLPGARDRPTGRLPHPQRGPRAGGPPAAARRGRRMILERSLTAALQLREGGDGRTLVGPLLPWGTTARVVDRGRLVDETFERGALAGNDPARVPLMARHPRDPETLPIGRTLEIDERADAAWGAWHVSKTALGDEVLELARDGVPLGLSVGFMEVPGGSRWSPDRKRVTRTRAQLDHVAVVRVPAYVGAGVVGIRARDGGRSGVPLATLARRWR